MKLSHGLWSEYFCGPSVRGLCLGYIYPKSCYLGNGKRLTKLSPLGILWIKCHQHNGSEENEIKNMVRIYRTMMIQDALVCPDASENNLLPMDIAYDVHLCKHNTQLSSGLYPEEVWTSSKSSLSNLQIDNPWGCPAYVLEPRLQDGNKFPKWMPRYSRYQYLGPSPLHDSTVGLVRNLQTYNIIQQFHLVFDDYFETVNTGEDQ